MKGIISFKEKLHNDKMKKQKKQKEKNYELAPSFKYTQGVKDVKNI